MTPLAVVRGTALTLRRSDVDLSVGQRAALVEHLDSSSARLERAVQQLLTADRLDRGEVLVRRRVVDVNTVIGLVVDDLRSAGARVHTRSDEGCGSAYVDPDLLWDVLDRLAQNALRNSPDGEPVVVGCRACGTGTRFWVSDRGPGIPARDQGRVFERFTANARHADGSTGLGLGLSVGRELVELMGGRLWIARSSAFGTTVAFELPRSPRTKRRESA